MTVDEEKRKRTIGRVTGAASGRARAMAAELMIKRMETANSAVAASAVNDIVKGTDGLNPPAAGEFLITSDGWIISAREKAEAERKLESAIREAICAMGPRETDATYKRNSGPYFKKKIGRPLKGDISIFSTLFLCH